MLLSAKVIVLINIFVCFLVPLVATSFIAQRRRVFRSFLVGILTCLLADVVIKAFWERFIFSKMDFFISLRYSFFGDVVFYPLFNALITVIVVLLLLLLAKCRSSFWKMLTYALGYCWINNSLACGKNQIEMLLDWLQPSESVYPVNVETLLVTLISMLLNSCVFLGIALIVQTSYISGKIIKYLLIALGMQFLANMIYPLFINWFAFSFWGVTFLRFALTIAIVIYSYLWFNNMRSISHEDEEEE